VIGKEEEVEKMNRYALKMAREVADETGTLMAGNICNTGVFYPNDDERNKEVEQMFKVRQVLKVEKCNEYIKLLCPNGSIAHSSTMYG